MDEIKTKKKLNKKPLIICLVLALVFGIVGFVDIKSNAAESLYTARIYCKASRTFQGVTTEEIKVDKTVTSNSPIYVYVHNYTEPTTDYVVYTAHVISRSPISGGSSNANRTFTDSDGLTWYCSRGFSVGGYTDEIINYSTWYAEGVESFCIINGSILDYEEFASAFKNGTLDYTQVIDYDNLITDFEIPVIENIKVNRIKNWVSAGLYNQYFDYVTWSGSDKYNVQVKKTFSVYFTRKVDFEDRFLGAEYNSSTMQDEILDIGCSSFTQQTDMQYITDYRQDDFNFYSNIRKNTDIDNWDKSEICFCYAIRYIDVENNKAGPWCYVLPSQNIGDFEQTFTCSYETEDGSFTENFSPDGTNESFKDFDEIGGIDNAKDTIDTENDFKDKYEIVDGNADTQEVMNWLNTVVSFIKGTPSIVTSVLSFLPQPILYGMYVTIFLGCIASAIAIVKALI